MKRIVKDAETRRIEILSAAEELFLTQGYVNTTVEAIIQKVGIAKGTFYYYFKSKEDILDALVHRIVDQLCQAYHKIASSPNVPVMDKMQLMLGGQNKYSGDNEQLMKNLHRPENRELHERINIEIIKKLSPILAQVIEQGKEESVFQVDNSLETVQFLLAGSQFLLESGLFQWTQEEQMKQLLSMQRIIERSFGADPGSFSFIVR
jgi:AcrR family transcriptional regulator